jgi:hypothetical protein
MAGDLSDFDQALGQMGAGIRRARVGFKAAAEAFAEADAGFLAALEALKAITVARGTLEERFAEMRETIARLDTEVLAHHEELRALRFELDATRAELRTRRPPS